jgi:hypothetical protein
MLSICNPIFFIVLCYNIIYSTGLESTIAEEIYRAATGYLKIYFVNVFLTIFQSSYYRSVLKGNLSIMKIFFFFERKIVIKVELRTTIDGK